MSKPEPLLQKHQHSNSLWVQTQMPKWNWVAPPRKDLLDSNCRTYDAGKHKLKRKMGNVLGIVSILQARPNKLGNCAWCPTHHSRGLHCFHCSCSTLKYSSSLSWCSCSFFMYLAVKLTLISNWSLLDEVTCIGSGHSVNDSCVHLPW